jgi:opacity protein-like surface antigen
MKSKVLSLAIAVAVSVSITNDAQAKSPHSFRTSAEVQARSNTNISLAPSSNSSFNFASLKDFDDSEEDGVEGESEEEDEEFEEIGDIEGSDYDELELAESDNPDEDGDGVDDLIDDDQDTGDGDDEEDDDGDDDGDGGDDGLAGKAIRANRASSVERYTSKFGLAHKYEISKAASYATSAKFSLDRQPGRSDLNKLNAAFSTGPEFKLSKRVKLKTGLSFIRLQQDSDNFLSTWAGTLGMDFDASKNFTLGFDYNYQDKDVTDPDSPDAIINTLTFGADWKLSSNDILKFKYSPQVEDNSVVTRDKDVSGFEVAYSRKLPWDTVLGIGFKRDDVDYDKLPRPRSDEVNAVGVQLETEFSKQASASIAYETRRLDSNINSKDGKNRSVVLSFGYKF